MDIQIQARQPVRKKQNPWIFTGILATVTVALGLAAISFSASNNSSAIQRVASMVGIGKPVITKCHAHVFLTASYSSSSYNLRFVATVENGTSSAIDSLFFYVRSKAKDRTVPSGEDVQSVDIRGGIEPGETREIEFTVVGRRFYENLHSVKNIKDPVEIGIVDKLEFEPYYNKYNVKMTPVKLVGQ